MGSFGPSRPGTFGPVRRAQCIQPGRSAAGQPGRRLAGRPAGRAAQRARRRHGRGSAGRGGSSSWPARRRQRRAGRALGRWPPRARTWRGVAWRGVASNTCIAGGIRDSTCRAGTSMKARSVIFACLGHELGAERLAPNAEDQRKPSTASSASSTPQSSSRERCPTMSPRRVTSTAPICSTRTRVGSPATSTSGRNDAGRALRDVGATITTERGRSSSACTTTARRSPCCQDLEAVDGIEVTVDVELEAPLELLVSHARAARRRLDLTQQEAQDSLQLAAVELRERGLSLRDIGSVLGAYLHAAPTGAAAAPRSIAGSPRGRGGCAARTSPSAPVARRSSAARTAPPPRGAWRG